MKKIDRIEFVNKLVNRLKSKEITYKAFEDIVKTITDERTLSLIRNKLLLPNASLEKPNSLVAFSFHSPQKEFQERFMSVSYHAFVCRMLDEWDPDMYQDHVSEKSEIYQARFQDICHEFIKDRAFQLVEVPDSLEGIEKKRAEAIASKTYVHYLRLDLQYARTDDEKRTILEMINEYQTLFTQLRKSYSTLKGMKHGSNVKRKKSKTHPLDLLQPIIYEPTPEDIVCIRNQVKETLGISHTREDKIKEHKVVMAKFFDEYFRYNPDIHAICKYKPLFDEKLLEQIRDNPDTDIDKLLRAYKQNKETQYTLCLSPPEDTFVRYNNYVKSNYFELEQATKDIYPDISTSLKGIENTVLVYGIISGKDDTELTRNKEKFLREHKYDFIGPVRLAPLGKYIMLQENGAEELNLDVANKYMQRLSELNEENRGIANAMIKKRIEKDKLKSGIDEDTQRKMNKRTEKKMRDLDIYNVTDLEEDHLAELPDDILEASLNEVEVVFKNIKNIRVDRFTNVQFTQQKTINLEGDKPPE